MIMENTETLIEIPSIKTGKTEKTIVVCDKTQVRLDDSEEKILKIEIDNKDKNISSKIVISIINDNSCFMLVSTTFKFENMKLFSQGNLPYQAPVKIDKVELVKFLNYFNNANRLDSHYAMLKVLVDFFWKYSNKSSALPYIVVNKNTSSFIINRRSKKEKKFKEYFFDNKIFNKEEII